MLSYEKSALVATDSARDDMYEMLWTDDQIYENVFNNDQVGVVILGIDDFSGYVSVQGKYGIMTLYSNGVFNYINTDGAKVSPGTFVQDVFSYRVSLDGVIDSAQIEVVIWNGDMAVVQAVDDYFSMNDNEYEFEGNVISNANHG